MNQKVAMSLNCEVQIIKGLKITVANGEILQTQKLCKEVVLELQGLKTKG